MVLFNWLYPLLTFSSLNPLIVFLWLSTFLCFCKILARRTYSVEKRFLCLIINLIDTSDCNFLLLSDKAEWPEQFLRAQGLIKILRTPSYFKLRNNGSAVEKKCSYFFLFPLKLPFWFVHKQWEGIHSFENVLESLSPTYILEVYFYLHILISISFFFTLPLFLPLSSLLSPFLTSKRPKSAWCDRCSHLPVIIWILLSPASYFHFPEYPLSQSTIKINQN